MSLPLIYHGPLAIIQEVFLRQEKLEGFYSQAENNPIFLKSAVAFAIVVP